jgi:hypothetical protein
MRARIHAHFTDLHHQRETIEAELQALATGTGRADDVDLLDELPELTGHLDDLPEHLQAALFAAFDIQVVWNQPMNQVTFYAAITDTTPGTVTELLALTGGDPASAETGPAPTQAPATSINTASGFTRLPIGSLAGPEEPGTEHSGQQAGQVACHEMPALFLTGAAAACAANFACASALSSSYLSFAFMMSPPIFGAQSEPFTAGNPFDRAVGAEAGGISAMYMAFEMFLIRPLEPAA